MKIILAGPSITQRGGIASVLKGLRCFLTSKHIAVQVIPTTIDSHRTQVILTFLRAWAAVLGGCLQRRTDIVHLHMSVRGSCLRKSVLAITCWILRTPYVLHLHSGGFHNFYEKDLGPISRSLVKFVFIHAAQVIAISSAWQEWLEKAMKLKNVTVVFNGVESCEATATRNNNLNVLFLGRLGPNKGTNELLVAMREVIKQVPDAVLELGGDGDINTYRQLAADLPNVRFLGWVDDSDRRAALARAKIYCLPSWSEGLPMSVLEAMSAGLPVVSTPVGGIPEAVENGVTGLLVRPGDVEGLTEAICKLLLDPEKANSMGKIGQARHREKFSTEAMGQGCLEVYASCLQRH